MKRSTHRLLLASALGLAMFAQGASAHLRVEVIDASSGHAVKNASVCLGYVAGGSEVIRRAVGPHGKLDLMHVPRMPLQLTVTANGKSTVHRALPRLDHPMTIQVSLKHGVRTSGCHAPVSQVVKPASKPLHTVAGVRIERPRVLNVMLRATDTQRFRLTSSATGMPTHIRVAATSSFNGAQWLAYSPEMELALPFRSGQSVFVQLKRAARLPDQLAEVSVDSSVVNLAIH